MEAQHAPVKRTYNRQTVHSEDTPLAQKDDLDLSLDKPLQRETGFANVGGASVGVGDGYGVPIPVDIPKEKFNDPEFMAAFPAFMAKLAFNEEPVTIIIEENSRSDHPETHVPVAVQGRGAEVLVNGKWVTIGWLPVNQQLTTKRKYVENLLRSKSDLVRTEHEDANVERPRNAVRRSTSANYPVTIIDDANPAGREWVSNIRRQH